MRKLASIRKIAELTPIPGADMIETARIDGWQVVVKRGEFQVGDLCVYFEIDSFLPELPIFEFLRKSSHKRMGNVDGFRLRTIKLRKQISQGLALPVKDFALDERLLVEGADLTDQLGVKKYESAVERGVGVKPGAAKTRSFPHFIRKTDQERVQNCFDMIKAQHPDTLFEVSLKLDGSSMTVFRKDNQYGTCSRNYLLAEDSPSIINRLIRTIGAWFGAGPNRLNILEFRAERFMRRLGKKPTVTTQQNNFLAVTKRLELYQALERSGRNVALQGELMGPGIQGNREKLDQHDFYLFDIWDIDAQRYLSPGEREVFRSQYLPQVSPCPVLSWFKPSHWDNVQQVLEFAERPSINNPVAEGVVFKSMCGQTSFKAISNRFLLAEVD